MTDIDLGRIGCSDYGAVLQLPGHSRFGLVARCAHGIHPEESESLRTLGEWGKRDERTTASMLMRELQRENDPLFKPPSRLVPGREWQRYSLDFVAGVSVLSYTAFEAQFGGMETCSEVVADRIPILNERTPPLVIECKLREWRIFSAEGWGAESSDEIPVDIGAQVQGQMDAIWADRDFWIGTTVPEVESITVAVRVGAYELHSFVVPRNRDVGARLAEEAEKLWRDYIVPKVMPPLDGTSAAHDWLLSQHPAPSSKKRRPPLDEAELRIIAEYRVLREKIRADSAQLELLEQQLCASIGDGYGIEGDLPAEAGEPERFTFTWPTRAGRTKDSEIIEVLRQRAGLLTADIEALKEDHRGKSYRYVDARFGLR